MKIVRKVNAPAYFIFDKIMDSSIYDITSVTGKEMKMEELEGFEYNKTFSTKLKAKIKILKVEKNQAYQFQTTTSIRDFITTYHLKELASNKCEITCEESHETEGSLLKYNDILTGFVLGRQRKRQMKILFDSMAREYQKAS